MIGTRSLGRSLLRIALRVNDLPSADAQTRRAKLWFSQTTFYERYDLSRAANRQHRSTTISDIRISFVTFQALRLTLYFEFSSCIGQRSDAVNRDIDR